jgi:Zn-dependent metalloprotease
MRTRHTFVTAVATAVLLTLAGPAALAETGKHVTATAAVKIDAKAAAEKALKANAAKYGFKTDLADLQYVTTIETPAGTYVRYQQTVEGQTLFAKQVTVTLDKAGNNVLIVSDYVPNLKVESTKKNFTENDAEKKALEHTGTQGVKEMTSRQFGYYEQDGVAYPVYKVNLHPNHKEGSYEVLVHAGTGKVLREKRTDRHVNGTGKVFLPNPVQSQGSTTGLTDNRDADSTALNNQLKAVTLQGLDGSGYLRGSYVNISSKAKTYSSTYTYNFTRNSDSFEDVMVYYHIDSLQRDIQGLGFSNILNGPITVNVNGTTQDNSWYSPSTKQLTFGSGGVDDAEDAGIIAHEYGHAIQDNQVPGFGETPEGGAMGEGFGDFLGATWEDALAPNPTFSACIGEWDATSYSSSNPPCLRRLDKNKVYPQDWYGEVHVDGEIWSQGEYEMAKAFGRDIATKLILQSHWSLTPSSDFADGVAAIKAADQLLYNGQHLSQITAIWNARGL